MRQATHFSSATRRGNDTTMSLQYKHRHAFPGWATSGAKSVDPKDPDATKWWHDASAKHVKYPTAHNSVLETREFTPGTRKGKIAVYTGPVNEYGEPVTLPDPNVEYLASLGAPIAAEAVKEAEEVVKKAGNRPRAAKA